MRLLAVDDSPIALEMLPKLFPRPEFAFVGVARSGPEALDILSAPGAAFDCMLLDIEMPGMDGIELCRRIRALPGHRHTPIIMLTARDDGDTIERAFVAGANDHLVKQNRVSEYIGRVKVAGRLLAEENRFHVERRQTAGEIDGDGNGVPGRHPFHISDDLTIDGVDRLILPFSFGNYLTQLGREDLYRCKMFAVRIEDVTVHYRSTTTAEFCSILATIAEGIAKVAESRRLLMAYSGDGNFLCVVRDSKVPDPEAFEALMARHLRAAARRSRLDRLVGVRVTVGAQTPPCAHRNQRVRRSLERALARLEARQRQKLFS
ncbi:hypothetical protein ATO6_07910 [Oceanicola sp. 22II-s10i]|nr:hypothetical protein ATO6_07910 [Oceanicola sp. 22II-s10i]